MHVLFFLVAFVLSVVLPFIFGRIVVIDTEIQVGDARLGRIVISDCCLVLTDARERIHLHGSCNQWGYIGCRQ